jgi:hypothetical protein
MPRGNASELLKLEISVRLQDLQRRKGGVAPLNVDEVTAVDRTLTDLLGIAEAYDADDKVIAADPDLSESGRRKAREKVARAALQKIADFEAANVTRPRERAAELGRIALKKAVIQRPTDPAQFAVYTAQMRTLWERLAQADPLEADLLAMTTTDPLVLDAIATCPPVWRRPDKHSPQTLVPLVNQERIAAATLARARSTDPETAARLEQIERLAACYEGSLNGVRSAILEQVAEAQADPVAADAR